MGATAAVVTVALLGGGAWMLNGPGDGPVECAKAIWNDNLFSYSALDACSGIDLKQHADAKIPGPIQTERERVISEKITMTFGEVAMMLSFPTDPETGSQSKLDWDPGGFRSCIGECATLKVRTTPFQVIYTPCAKLGDDYKKVDVGKDVSADTSGKDRESTFRLETVPEVQKDPVTGQDVPTGREKLVAHTSALTACNVRIPTEAVDQNGVKTPNAILVDEQNDSFSGPVNAGVKNTFLYIHEDIALNYVPAAACFEDLLDIKAVYDQLANYVQGVVDKKYSDLKDLPLQVVVDNPAAPHEEGLKNYGEIVKKYQDLDKSLFADGDGSKKNMHVQFTSNLVQQATDIPCNNRQAAIDGAPLVVG